MGILCDPSHPALAAFPTDAHSDWQWWDLMRGSHAFILNDPPPGFQPLVQVIDDAGRAFRLGVVREARVGSGKLLATSFDLESLPDRRLPARQLRHSLLQYAGSRQFEPAAELSLEFLDTILRAGEKQ